MIYDTRLTINALNTFGLQQVLSLSGPATGELFLKEEKGNDADGDGSVCYVEYRAEKFKVIAADKGKPARIVRLYEGEI